MKKRYTLLFILTMIAFAACSVAVADDDDKPGKGENERIHRLLGDLQQTQADLSRFSGLLLDESLKLKQQVMMMEQMITELQGILIASETTQALDAETEEKGGSAFLDLTILVILVVILLSVLIFLRNRRSFKENEEFSKEFGETWSVPEEEDDEETK